MRHYDTCTSCGSMSCGSMSCLQRERMVYQNSSSNPYIVVQWCSDTISEMTHDQVYMMSAINKQELLT